MVEIRDGSKDGKCCENCDNYNPYRAGYCEEHELRVFKFNYCKEYDEEESRQT